MVFNVHAPDCAMNFEEHQKFMQTPRKVPFWLKSSHLFFFCVVCVSLSRFWRSSFASCRCGFDHSSFLEISSSQWRLMTEQREMGLKRRRERVSLLVKCGKRIFWQRRSLSTVTRSGIAASARRRMFGRDRSVEGVRLRFRQCYKPNTCKRCHRRADGPGQHHLRQLMERTKFCRTKASG